MAPSTRSLIALGASALLSACSTLKEPSPIFVDQGNYEPTAHYLPKYIKPEIRRSRIDSKFSLAAEGDDWPSPGLKLFGFIPIRPGSMKELTVAGATVENRHLLLANFEEEQFTPGEKVDKVREQAAWNRLPGTDKVTKQVDVPSFRTRNIEFERAPGHYSLSVTDLGGNEATYQSWSFAFDNDVLLPGSRDQDYTYGASASLSSETAPLSRWSLNTPLQWINSHSAVSALGNSVRTYSTEIGLYGFTPEDVTRRDANLDDRPYASLLYVSNSQEHAGVRPDIAWRSTFTVGVLGLDLAGDLQNEVHAVVGSDDAHGWHHQISDGGEPTARYSVARQRLWTSGHSNVEIKTSLQGSVGYLTELSYGVSLRIGRIATRWQSFNPELANYREHSVPALLGKGYRESYFSAGMAIKGRAYNVFLQGQFRDSDVEYDNGDVNHRIIEAWAGYTHIFASGYRVSYTLRGHNSEINSGAGDRSVIWGGLTFAKSF